MQAIVASEATIGLRPVKSGGFACNVLWQPRSVRWLRRKRRDVFKALFWIPLPYWRIWMRCENEKCFNPSHMELVSVWEMGRRYQKRVVTKAKERRKW